MAGKCNTVPDSLCHIGSEWLIENEFALTVMKSGSLHNGQLKNVTTKIPDFLGGQHRCNDGARCADCLENQDCSAGEVINLFKMRDDHTFRCFVDHCDSLMGIDVSLRIEYHEM